jgi:hypothetical protein
MRTLQKLLQDYEKRLNELTSHLYSDATTPEVRPILIATCKSAIEQLSRDMNSAARSDYKRSPRETLRS